MYNLKSNQIKSIGKQSLHTYDKCLVRKHMLVYYVLKLHTIYSSSHTIYHVPFSEKYTVWNERKVLHRTLLNLNNIFYNVLFYLFKIMPEHKCLPQCLNFNFRSLSNLISLKR